MDWLTEDADLKCAHLGPVDVPPTQSLVRIGGRRVLVATDPEKQTITGCPNTGPTIKPCTTTLRVTEGYSVLVRIGGAAVCLDSVTGLTDGTPPGTVRYRVYDPGQQMVRAGC